MWSSFLYGLKQIGIIAWIVLFFGTAAEYLGSGSQQEIQRHAEALARNEAIVSQLQAANLVSRLSALEVESRTSKETLDRVERWLLLIFSMFGGKILLDRRGVVKLQSRVGEVEKNQQHLRASVHKMNGLLQQIVLCGEPKCPIMTKRDIPEDNFQ